MVFHVLKNHWCSNHTNTFEQTFRQTNALRDQSQGNSNFTYTSLAIREPSTCRCRKTPPSSIPAPYTQSRTAVSYSRWHGVARKREQRTREPKSTHPSRKTAVGTYRPGYLRSPRCTTSFRSSRWRVLTIDHSRASSAAALAIKLQRSNPISTAFIESIALFQLRQ